MAPVRSEQEPASPQSPRRALLDRVAEADIYLLILGTRYGDATSSGLSPTHEEYDEAQRLNRPTIVMVTDQDLEPDQQRFLEAIRAGGWDASKLYGRFSTPEDLALEVLAALAKLTRTDAREDPEAAAARAKRVVMPTRSGAGSGVTARCAFVPTSEAILLDALALERPGLADAISGAARSSGLFPHSVGFTAEISASGIAIIGQPPVDWVTLTATIGTDGVVVVQGSVASRGPDVGMGMRRLSPSALFEFLAAAGRFAFSVWQEVDQHEQVRRVASVVCIPDSDYLGFGDGRETTVSLGGSVPSNLVLPEPPVFLNRRDLPQRGWVEGMIATVRRVFADAGRV